MSFYLVCRFHLIQFPIELSSDKSLKSKQKVAQAENQVYPLEKASKLGESKSNKACNDATTLQTLIGYKLVLPPGNNN